MGNLLVWSTSLQWTPVSPVLWEIVFWLKSDTAISACKRLAGLQADMLPYQFKLWYHVGSIEHSWLSICWCGYLFVLNGASGFLYVTVQWLDWIPISNFNAHTVLCPAIVAFNCQWAPPRLCATHLNTWANPNKAGWWKGNLCTSERCNKRDSSE